jgi:hypothetical protein
MRRYALLGISYHADIASLADEEVDEEILDLVRVLVFVDQNIIEPLLPTCSDVGLLRKEIDDEINEIIVIEGIAFFHLDKILCRDRCKAGHRIGEARDIIDNVTPIILLRPGNNAPRRIGMFDIHSAFPQDILD